MTPNELIVSNFEPKLPKPSSSIFSNFLIRFFLSFSQNGQYAIFLFIKLGYSVSPGILYLQLTQLAVAKDP